MELLVVFLEIQNEPNEIMRIAAGQAGIQASLPGYRPAGFAMDHSIQSLPDEVILQFRSTTDDRSFKISQVGAPQADNSLVTNHLADASQSYRILDTADGTTVYLYGTANASWVKNSTWYTIEGNSNLSPIQLVKIANSF